VGSRPSRYRSRSLTDNAVPFRLIRAFRGPPPNATLHTFLSVIIRVIPWPPRGVTEPSTAAHEYDQILFS
jgi:hypothetical protein